METFLEHEKKWYEEFKQNAAYFSPDARAKNGYFGEMAYPFCLPVECAEENLFKGIRQSAQAFFKAHEIKWHRGQHRNPSNHLCSSQICCVNFLFAFGDQPRALATLLRPLYPDLVEMEIIEDGRYVSFEWIGADNYLGEKKPLNGKRPRGALFTSADAAVMFRRKDGKRQIVLIEWKYTESYSSTDYRIAKSGIKRTSIYQHLYDLDDGPLDKTKLPSFESLFYEPFYQLMRQQFLAHKMEVARELGADVVSSLHIAPDHNKKFRRVTSPVLKAHPELGETAIEVWKSLVCAPGRFQSVSIEKLFGALTVEQVPEMTGWLDYIHARYPWVLEAET